MIYKPTVSLWLDTRRSKKNKKFPVKIRLTFERKHYYYPTNIDLSEIEFGIVLSPKPGIKLKDTHFKLTEFERQANDAVNDLSDNSNIHFSIPLFEKHLNIGSSKANDVFICFDRKIADLSINDQINTAAGYRAAKNALHKYFGKITLPFTSIDKEFLSAFEKYMTAEKKSLATVGIYMRYLRTIINQYMDEKSLKITSYPFGKNKYQIPQPSNNKRALDEIDLQKIFQYKPEENTWEDYSKDMWTFSLLCQGMNMKDIANLRLKNIQDNKICFIREKTKKRRTSSAQMPLTVYIDDFTKAIIKKWGTDSSKPNDFLFPIFSDDNTAKRNIKIVQQQIKMINKHVRHIAAKLEIKQDVTFYSARHSFATTLKRQGRSIEEIQEFLGHADKKTTELYLASFGDNHKIKIMNNFVKHLNAAIK